MTSAKKKKNSHAGAWITSGVIAASLAALVIYLVVTTLITPKDSYYVDFASQEDIDAEEKRDAYRAAQDK